MIMFIVDLKRCLRKVRQEVVVVKVCKKTVWAISEDGTRHLVGSSAFQTLTSAERCRYALLQKMVADPYYKHMHYFAHASAVKQLALFH